MEKRYTSKADDSNISDVPDRKAGWFLLFISGLLIAGIGIAVVAAMAINKKQNTGESSSGMTTAQSTETKSSVQVAETFTGKYGEGSVPTDIMKLNWGVSISQIKTSFPDTVREEASSLADEQGTINLTYERKGTVGGFAYSNVMLSTDEEDGLYAFAYLLEKNRYSEIFAALSEEYGRPRFKSGESSYWDLDENVIIYLAARTNPVTGQENAVLQYINTAEPENTADPEKPPVLTLGMTPDEVRRRKLNIRKYETTAVGSEVYISEGNHDISSDSNLGKFAPGNASAVMLYFDPRTDLTAYSFIVRGDHLYEVREKLASEYGNPSINRDYSSQWNLSDGKAYITVTYGRMSGAGRGFATEIRYSCTPYGYQAMDMVKAVGRATRKGMKYSEVMDEIGKYSPSVNINKKGNGSITFLNRDGADIIVFGIRVRSVEIEFAKNKVTDVYYIFDGSSYDGLKMNIETNYGPGEPKLRFKDRIKRVLWQPKTTENNKFTRLMLDYVQLKVNPKCRVHYYG